MWIQFTTSVAGARFAYRNKQQVDLRVDLARGFIRAGQAVAIEAPIEEAVASAPEQAVVRRGKKRGLGGLFRGCCATRSASRPRRRASRSPGRRSSATCASTTTSPTRTSSSTRSS